MGGQATVTLATMWAFVVIVFVFVGLRLYTRMHLIDSLGWDDHAYTAGSVRTSDRPCPGHLHIHQHGPYTIANLSSP